jgi:hypothetical protein
VDEAPLTHGRLGSVGMPAAFRGARTMRIAFILLMAICAAGQAAGQSGADCGNGYYCPSGNACLVGGLCGREVEQPAGSTLASGGWCQPGFRENRNNAGFCLPTTFTECGQTGRSCGPGYSCTADGRCDGGPLATGPQCGEFRCRQGDICSSRGTCMNPTFFVDCGNATLCGTGSACELSAGCVFVAPERTKQIQR